MYSSRSGLGILGSFFLSTSCFAFCRLPLSGELSLSDWKSYKMDYVQNEYNIFLLTLIVQVSLFLKWDPKLDSAHILINDQLLFSVLLLAKYRLKIKTSL